MHTNRFVCFTSENTKRRTNMERIGVSRRKALEGGGLRTGWNGCVLGGGKRARRCGTEHDDRRNRPEVVQDLGGREKGLGPIRCPAGRQLCVLKRPATTTSVRVLSRRIAGIHRLILSDSLTWNGWSQVATRRLRSIFATRKMVNRSGMWSIFASRTGRWSQ